MAETRFDDAFAPIAVATRNELDESLHHGAGVVLGADGRSLSTVGDAELIVYPRSSLKPLQADAMVGLGLDLPADLLALVCASHSGEAMHLDGVRRILALHGLDETALQNTPARPYGAAARSAARDVGSAPSSLQQNCSGKHAGMLATCRLNGWSIDDYLSAEHPLQQAITAWIVRLIDNDGDNGDQHDAHLGTHAGVTHIGVDGCGAPTHAFSLTGLARAFASLARSGGAVATAMATNPLMVGGTGRDVSAWIQAVPGLVAKEGAAGVMAAALPDGRAFAFKIADGADTARQAVTVEAMRLLGVDADVVETVARAVAVPMLGHGIVVGELHALNWTA